MRRFIATDQPREGSFPNAVYPPDIGFYTQCQSIFIFAGHQTRENCIESVPALQKFSDSLPNIHGALP
jgi:hypothetical protein